MKKETIIKAISKIIDFKDIKIERIKHEEDDGFYDAWYVIADGNKYVFKKSKQLEIDVYLKVKHSSLSKFYGFINYYKNYYILIEYIDGENLNKANQESLKLVLDSLINIQDKYWDSKVNIGFSYQECYERVQNRKNYLFNSILEKVYDKFLEDFKNCIKTFVHFDLLPFNLIVGTSSSISQSTSIISSTS